MEKANIAPLTPATFWAREDLKQLAASGSEIGRFRADEDEFVIKQVSSIHAGKVVQDAMRVGDVADPHHVEAVLSMRDYLHRYLAVGPDGFVYAMWEIYSKHPHDLVETESRTIEVDHRWTGREIGFWLAVILVQRGANFSKRLTPAGAKLKAKVEAYLADEKLAATPNAANSRPVVTKMP